MDMPSNKKTKMKAQTESKEQEYVTVAVLDDIQQANEYKRLLDINDIPATVVEEFDADNAQSIAVMVPEEYIDEAHVVIESQDAYDDFYDMALEDDMDDFDDGLLDEDF